MLDGRHGHVQLGAAGLAGERHADRVKQRSALQSRALPDARGGRAKRLAVAKARRAGWYFTGDTGYADAEGDLYVTGRVDDMIICGGENISPVDIESVLSLHPAVDEVAVAGLPDERWGQRVVAFVKAKAPVDAQGLDDYCRDSVLPNYKRPREYVFVKAVPKSPVGKILRRKLISGEFDRA